MKKILFVCHGNICRSPMAEFVLKDMVKNLNIENDFYITSRATSTEEVGNSIYPPVKKLLDSKNIDSSSHIARQVKKDDYDEFDYIIAMDQNNLRNIKKIIKDDRDEKVKLLMDYTNDKRDIDDPWYTRDFQATWRDINLACREFLKYLGY